MCTYDDFSNGSVLVVLDGDALEAAALARSGTAFPWSLEVRHWHASCLISDAHHHGEWMDLRAAVASAAVTLFFDVEDVLDRVLKSGNTEFVLARAAKESL